MSSNEQSMQYQVRAALTKAGHGARACDSFGGEAWIGFHTYPMSQGSVFVGFTADPMRVDEASFKAINPVMIANYAQTLRFDGFAVEQVYGGLLVREAVVEAVAEEADEAPDHAQRAFSGTFAFMAQEETETAAEKANRYTMLKAREIAKRDRISLEAALQLLSEGTA